MVPLLVSFAIYSLAFFLGTPRYLGRPLFWVVAAMAAAAPLVIGSWRERRR
jgi:hypothetical protein